MSSLTVYQLPFSLYSRVAPLYADIRHDLTFREAVYDDIFPANIFVDDADAPTAAVIMHPFEWYVAGAVETPLRHFFADAPAEAYDGYFAYSVVTDTWVQALMADTPGLNLLERRDFTWPSGKPVPSWRDRLPANSHVEIIDGALAERIDRERGEHLGQYMGGYDKYQAYGFGACLFIGDDIASVAYTCGVSRTRANIGIVTMPEFRQRGYAMLVAASFIEQTLDRGLIPTWCTDLINVGSGHMAEKLGYEEGPRSWQVNPYWGQTLTTHPGVWQAHPPRADGVIEWERADLTPNPSPQAERGVSLRGQ